MQFARYAEIKEDDIMLKMKHLKGNDKVFNLYAETGNQCFLDIYQTGWTYTDNEQDIRDIIDSTLNPVE